MEPGKNGAECVCILNGIHRGAVIDLEKGAVSLGGISGCDALIADESAAQSAAELALDANGDLIVTAREGTVRIGARTIRSEQCASLLKGVVLRMGDVSIARGSNPSMARKEVALRDRRRRGLNWTIATAASLSLVAGLGAIGGGSADAVIAFGDIDTVQASSASAGGQDGTALNALRREIERANLSEAVSAERLAQSQQILVTGAVTSDERAQWSSVARWFDGRYGGRTMLKAELEEHDDALVVPFRILSVVMAPNPRIVIQDGRVFPVGAVLPGGWEIRRIADMKVMLARGNGELEIAF